MKKIIFIISVLTYFNSYAQKLYDISNITSIDITFSDSNWDQTMDTYYSNDIGERLLGSAVINGVQYDSIGVKYKGNSTYNANNGKNPLNIKLDYIKKADYDGYTTIKLSSGDKDPSFVREILSYEIGRNYMDMPLSNYAYVTINGSDYGLFSSSESIDSDFQTKYLNANKSNTRFKCNPIGGAGPGATKLPTLEYLGTDSSNYATSYELKSNFGWNDLVSFTENLTNNTANLESFLDVDRAIWMLAFDNVFVNMDSYIGAFQQNYYLIKDDNELMTTIIWDLNESIGGFPVSMGGGGPGGPGGGSSITSITDMDLFINEGKSSFPLVNALFNNPRYRKMYVAHAKTIIQEFIENGWYLTEAQKIQDVAAAKVQSDPNANYTYTEFTGNLTSTQSGEFSIQAVMDGRATYLNSTTEFGYAQPIIANITTLPNVVTANSNVTITAEITNGTYVFLAYRNSSKDIFTKLEMKDDGNNGDGSAADNVFGIVIPTQNTGIEYYIYAENSNAGMFSPQRAAHEFHTLGISGSVVINELMASNTSTIADQDGEFDDWIELYNNTSSAISLNGFYLSDDGLKLNKWAFPDTSISPNDYLILWADGDTLQSGLHTNFKLSSAGESVFLSNGSLSIIDQVDFLSQTSDISFGRFNNGTGAFTSMTATFEAENTMTTTSILNVENLFDFNIFPNPTHQFITIEGMFDSGVMLEVYDMQGRRLLQERINNLSKIDLSNWDSGIYLFKLEDKTQRVVKY